MEHAETRAFRGVCLPPAIWAVHFGAVYSLAAAACAPRGMMALDAARLSAVGATVLALILIGLVQLATAAGTEAGAQLRRGALWSGWISATAVLAGLIPALVFDSCV